MLHFCGIYATDWDEVLMRTNLCRMAWNTLYFISSDFSTVNNTNFCTNCNLPINWKVIHNHMQSEAWCFAIGKKMTGFGKKMTGLPDANLTM